jgi:hypothetical protein
MATHTYSSETLIQVLERLLGGPKIIPEDLVHSLAAALAKLLSGYVPESARTRDQPQAPSFPLIRGLAVISKNIASQHALAILNAVHPACSAVKKQPLHRSAVLTEGDSFKWLEVLAGYEVAWPLVASELLPATCCAIEKLAVQQDVQLALEHLWATPEATLAPSFTSTPVGTPAAQASALDGGSCARPSSPEDPTASAQNLRTRSTHADLQGADRALLRWQPRTVHGLATALTFKLLCGKPRLCESMVFPVRSSFGN